MPTLRTVTLGCKVNQYETEYLREGFLRLGYRDAEEGESADLCIFNTCTVTNQADSECRKILRRLARENPQAEIIVMGCFATKAAEEILHLPGVSEVLTDKRQMQELLARRGLVDVPTGVSGFAKRHRAYVKIQDGCVAACSYCIIPHVRGDLWSRPPREVLDEIARLVDNGYREIVLTGIHLGLYGRDGTNANSLDLATLVETIVNSRGGFRLRLSSLEVNEVTDALLELMAAWPDRICPHLHVPLQSGSSRILKRMRRRAEIGYFLERCALIREKLPIPALTTDVMVGFPGETDGDFAATCEVVEKIGFAKVHIFRFSPRKGTLAAEFPDQISEKLKKERAAILNEVAAKARERYIATLSGRILQVLWEDVVGGQTVFSPQSLLGMSDRYLPVRSTPDSAKQGELSWVTVNGFDGQFLLDCRIAASRVGTDLGPDRVQPIGFGCNSDNFPTS
ncbi:MAG: tRNA (N(6)-L-threonylcarbamoyladenosine(37)-C(2))-methylthiotransferase MtaB [Thermogutta sp.]